MTPTSETTSGSGTRKGAVRILGYLHHSLVFKRRIAVLAQRLSALLRPGCTLLDVGCGDGALAALIRDAVPALQVQGVEVHARPDCSIACRLFDGERLPFPDRSFDGCLFVDVLHHTENPLTILREACRVSREFILIKDHLSETSTDYWVLRLMDWVGNSPHGVPLPYRYLSRAQWEGLYRELGIEPVSTETHLPLYPAPFSLLFGRGLHFISLLRKPRREPALAGVSAA